MKIERPYVNEQVVDVSVMCLISIPETIMRGRKYYTYRNQEDMETRPATENRINLKEYSDRKK